MRPIDADELKSNLRAWAVIEKSPTFNDAYILIDAPPTIDAVPQWIPVTERLPEVYRDKYGELIPFLVCVKGTDYPFRAVFDGKNWGDGWYRIDDVIAWMPLPEPYKMDGKDGDENASK